VRPDLPTGTVTFLFTDVEGSTTLLRELGAEAYAEALAVHRRVVRAACAAHGGVEVDTQGDAFLVAFPTAPGALAASAAICEGLKPTPVRVRIGLHTGTPLVTDEGYVGADVHRAARIAGAGDGGQVLVSSSTAELVDKDALRNLGEHRLKDLSEPDRIYQLGYGEFPPLKALHQTNLPVASTPFLGREKEVAEVGGLLARRDVRLLTLTGPGGIGKTRLAAQAAGWAADGYPDGVWWVPLDTLRDPTLVLESAAQAIGAKRGLAAHIGDKRMLVLFDCFERVVEGAGSLADLRAACSNLKLLVTSQERLHLTGEQEYAVPPFAHEEAVGFFTARARTAKHDFEADETVSEICRRLDDIPLALELAAARVKALSTRQILDRGLSLSAPGPRDLPDRQRTLRATIEWSYDLLTDQEQHLFRRLAVFAGGSTLEAAEEVADADIETLHSLVDKSLLRHTGERYRMLDTIREYALELFAETGESDHLLERLFRYLVDLANAEGAPLYLERAVEAYERLDLEHANVRAVVDWAVRQGRPERIGELVAVYGDVWLARGHTSEAGGWVEAALRGRGKLSEELLPHVLLGAEQVFLARGDWSRAKALMEEALEVLSRIDSQPWPEAMVLAELSLIALREGRYEEAGRFAERSLALRIENGLTTAKPLGLLGELALHAGDLERAEGLLEDSARGWASLGLETEHAYVLDCLGEVARRRGDHERAAEIFADALRRYGSLGDGGGVGDCVQDLALLSRDRGELERAARLWAVGRSLRERAGGVSLRHREIGELPELAETTKVELSLEDAVAYALDSID